MTGEPKTDLYQRVTNQIIAAIEAGAGEYRMPWNLRLCGGASVRIPHNPVTAASRASEAASYLRALSDASAEDRAA